MSVGFLAKQVKISSSVATDWASFHREVVMDGMILRHEKIGKFELQYFTRLKNQVTVYNYLN